MKTLLILGAGTAGTIMAGALRKKLPKGGWTITLIDRARDHYYQPGYLFMPFGIYKEDDVRRPMSRTVPRGVDYREADVDRVDAAALTGGRRTGGRWTRSASRRAGAGGAACT